jgi:hypothetical protein
MFQLSDFVLARLGQNDDFWAKSWSALAEMKGLRRLHFRVGFRQYAETLSRATISLLEKKLFGSLIAAKGSSDQMGLDC